MKKAPETQTLNALLQEIKGLSTPRPRRAQPDKYYQNKYWHSKLSAEFEQKRNETASETGETSAKVSVDNRNRFAKEKWDGKTEEEKAKIMEEIEAKYQEELEEYKRRCDWSGTALSYHDIWSNSENILSGITDAVGKLFGGGALLFVFGPQSTDGEVDIRSCTGVIPGSHVPKTDMFKFNPEAYKTATSMCVEFGRAAFSSEFCKSRIVPKEVLENVKADEDDDGDDEVSATVQESHASETSELPSQSHQGVTTASSQSVPEISTLTLPPPSSTATTATSSPSSALPTTLTQDPGSSPNSPPITTSLPEVNVNVAEARVGSTPSEVPGSANFPATSMPDGEPGTLIQCTQEELNEWWNAANVGGLFGDISIDNPNATSDEADKLQGNPYHQYRTTAMNAMPSNDGTFFNSNWNNPWGVNSDAAMCAYSNAGQVEDWALMQGGFTSTAPSNVQSYGFTAMQAAIPPSVAPPAMVPPSPSVPPPSTYTTTLADPALSSPPYADTQPVVMPAAATIVGPDQASATTPSPSLPPSTESLAASQPRTALAADTQLVVTPTVTTVGPDQAGAKTPSSLPLSTESSAASQPRTALTDRSDQTTPSVERLPSDGVENRPTTKRPDPPGDDVTAPPPKKRKPSAPVDLSDTIAARKSVRTIIKPTRMGEESDQEELPASKKVRAAPKKKAARGAKSG
ncbi:hypothetical protein PQX77_017057 [Marasmius sp. AFHP31]|nr:hypothetical protein PQX77_017057 [Marasmius sp. AFHP31]